MKVIVLSQPAFRGNQQLSRVGAMLSAYAKTIRLLDGISQVSVAYEASQCFRAFPAKAARYSIMLILYATA